MVIPMATWDDVRHAALALPQTSERSSEDGVFQRRVQGQAVRQVRDIASAMIGHSSTPIMNIM
jgi:hypothetical protein